MGTPTMARPGSANWPGPAPDAAGYSAVAVARWRIAALRAAVTALATAFFFELVASLALAVEMRGGPYPADPPDRSLFAWASWLFHYDASGVSYTYPPLLVWPTLLVAFVVASPLLVPRSTAIVRAGGRARFIWSAPAERARMAAGLRGLGAARTLLRAGHRRRVRIVAAETSAAVVVAMSAYTAVAQRAMFQTGRLTQAGYLTLGLGPKLCLVAGLLALAALPAAWPLPHERRVVVFRDGTVRPDGAPRPSPAVVPQPPPSGFVAPYLSGPPAKPTPRRRTVLFVVAAVVTLFAGLVVWAPWEHTATVARPGPLVAGATTATSASLRWTPPSTVPDQYVVTRDGTDLATVPGTVTSFTDTHAAPATSYRYQVVAVRDGHRSAPTEAVLIKTRTPGLASARLQGRFTTTMKVTASGGGNVTVGTRMTDTWRFTPTCATGPCPVVLSGKIGGGQFTPHSFRMELTRVAGRYTGTTVAHITHCGTTRVRDRLTLRLQVTKARPDGQAWAASAFSATLIETSPYTASGGGRYCPAQSHTMAVAGTH